MARRAPFLAALLLLSAAGIARARVVPGRHHKQDVSAFPQVRSNLTGRALDDQVLELPGWGPVEDFRLFAGYVTVDEHAGRHLSYILAESQGDPSSDPLVLWLNGGPGCSSFGGGFLSELGPWLPRPGGTQLQANPYAWNREASVLFVESPAFVGFSYSETESDSIVGDGRTARDMRAFLLGFLQRFPYLAERDLYISGESYAGHYLPTLAWEIVKGNRRVALEQQQQADPQQEAPPVPPTEIINFKGVLLGNPWTDTATDNLGAVDFWLYHALLSDETAQGIKANCDFERIGPLDHHSSSSNPHTRSGACDKFCNTAQVELGPINIYEIYADVCPGGDPDNRSRQSRVVHALINQLRQTNTTSTSSSPSLPLPLLGLHAAAAPHLLPSSSSSGQALSSHLQLSGSSSSRKGGSIIRSRMTARATRRLHEDDPDSDEGVQVYDPCVDDEVATYLNLPEVQRALHVNVSGDLPGPWTDCTNRISYSREDLLSSMLPVWRQLIEVPGLRFIIYSGDVDGIVPVVGTRRWVASLGLPVVRPWRPWLSGPSYNQQVGGYTVEFELPWQKEKKGQQQQQQEEQHEEEVDQAAPALRGAFVFATVRNAGHMVPYVQPQRALHLMARFLDARAL